MSGEVNGLGSFGYTYTSGNLTGKIDAVNYPNGMTADYDYYPVNGTANDSLLKQIHFKQSGGVTLSQYDYSYDAAGRIDNWSQQQGPTIASLKDYSFGYDKTSQLTDAVVKDSGGSTLKSGSWQYDPAGNRVRASEDVSSTYTQHNELNQMEQVGGAGTTLVEGVVDEPALLSVNGGSAIVLSQPGGDFLFRREVPVVEGANLITVEATDASGNTATQNYSVMVGGVEKTLEYDLNGNLRYEKDVSGTVLREFEWDAKNRLVKIIYGNDTSEFEYDGLDRRVRIVEKSNGVEVSNKVFIWNGTQIAQRRDSTGATVERSYYGQGFEEGSSSYYYTKDHLGSIREVVASDGTTVEAVYDYSPWGEVTKVSGSGVESDFLYTGHFYHEESDLHLTLYRAYNPELGMWLSRDPIAENGGLNLYAYVGNNPITRYDPLGLDWLDNASNFSAGFGDMISFGLTKRFRQALGYDDVVDRCSGWYKGGEFTAVGVGLAAGGATAARGALAMGGRSGSLATRLSRGGRRFFQDNRTFGSVSRQYWGSRGGANGNALHHWFRPQRAGGSNAGWNMLSIPSRLNSYMNGAQSTMWAENALRYGVAVSPALGLGAGISYGLERAKDRKDCD